MSQKTMLWTAGIALLAVAVANRIPQIRGLINNTAA